MRETDKLAIVTVLEVAPGLHKNQEVRMNHVARTSYIIRSGPGPGRRRRRRCFQSLKLASTTTSSQAPF